VKLLLDTDVLLWPLLAAQKLSPELRNAPEDGDNTLLGSITAIRVLWRHTSAERCFSLTLESHGQGD
jgi:PIN domain nuclease of toxin-antitoxin system